MEDDILNLVGLLYNAVADKARWEIFLRTLADTLGAESSSLLLYSPGDRAGNLDISAGLESSARRRYREYYVGIDQWGIQGRTHSSPVAEPCQPTRIGTGGCRAMSLTANNPSLIGRSALATRA